MSQHMVSFSSTTVTTHDRSTWLACHGPAAVSMSKRVPREIGELEKFLTYLAFELVSTGGSRNTSLEWGTLGPTRIDITDRHRS